MQISNALKTYYRIAKASISIEQLIFDVTKLILHFTPKNLHARILEKTENLNFDMHKMGQSSEFVPEKNTVYIHPDHVADANVYLHEIMHAIGTEITQKVTNIGISQKFNLKLNKENTLLINVGYGANEGLNQHYTEHFIKDYANVAAVSPEYSFLANLMSNFEKLVNREELKTFHFSSKNLPLLIKQVIKKCHLPNENKILKFILQLDAFNIVTRNQIVFGVAYSTEMRHALTSANKTLITMALIKAKNTHQDISFGDIIGFDHLQGDNLAYFNKYVLKDLESYFYKEKNHIMNEQTSGFAGVTYYDLFKNTYKIFSNYIKNSSFNGNEMPDALKCGEFYNFVLLNGCIADENGESKMFFTSDFQRDLTIAIFHQNNNMLPKHAHEMSQLIAQILSSRTVVRSGAEIEDKYIFEATADEEFCRYLMESCTDYFRANFANISYQAKQNATLVEKMLSEVFLQRVDLHRFKKLMPQELLEREDIKELLTKYKVDEKLAVNTKCEKQNDL